MVEKINDKRDDDESGRLSDYYLAKMETGFYRNVNSLTLLNEAKRARCSETALKAEKKFFQMEAKRNACALEMLKIFVEAVRVGETCCNK